MELSEPVLALMAAIFGGAGLKVIETLLARSTRRADIAKEIRDELRGEVLGLREQLVAIDERLEHWKEQYYDLLAAFNDLIVVAQQAGLDDDIRRIRKRLDK